METPPTIAFTAEEIRARLPEAREIVEGGGTVVLTHGRKRKPWGVIVPPGWAGTSECTVSLDSATEAGIRTLMFYATPSSVRQCANGDHGPLLARLAREVLDE